MKTKELLKILKKHGVTFVRSGGNHDIYYFYIDSSIKKER